MPFTHVAKLIFKALAGLLTLGVIGIGLILGSMWLDHRNATTLPVPTGGFAVGRTSFAWVDSTQTDKLAPQPGMPRELVVWIWYPSADHSATATTMADYLPIPWRVAVEQYRGVLVSSFLERDLSRVQTHSARHPWVSPQQPAYPIVIMRPGASALTAEYAVLAEDLASHGYVVVGFDAPYRTQVVVFPDARVIKRTPDNDPDLYSGTDLNHVGNKLLHAWTSDTALVLDQMEKLNAADPSGRFTGRLDMNHVGVFGHSLGGATALQFCHEDLRCKAGIDVDGLVLGSVVREGLHKPFMFLMSDHSSDAADPDTGRIETEIKAIYDRLSPGERLRVVIRGANHYGFSDGAILRSPHMQRVLQMLGVISVDGRQQLAITTYYVHSFFDVYLKGMPRSTLDKPPPLYPEVQVTD